MSTTMESQHVVTRANQVPGPAQGNWTYDHYATLPNDGQRYEIVDGVLFMTPAPGILHQKVAQRLFRVLSTFIEDTGLGQVFIAPVDVVLAPGVVVQPDILVILNEESNKVTPSRILGAPSLVVEVSSPATIGYDRREKQNVYARAGVKEYWIAHPGEKTVEVLSLEGNEYFSLGCFSDQQNLVSKIVPAMSQVAVAQFFA